MQLARLRLDTLRHSLCMQVARADPLSAPHPAGWLVGAGCGLAGGAGRDGSGALTVSGRVVTADTPSLSVTWSPTVSVAGVSWSELENAAPALLLVGMTVTMTVPMVAWMRHRGHGWPASAEMTAAMFIPTFGVIALLGTGLVRDVGMLLMIEHLVMPASMLVAMLLRRDEYTRATHRHGQAQNQPTDAQAAAAV